MNAEVFIFDMNTENTLINMIKTNLIKFKTRIPAIPVLKKDEKYTLIGGFNILKAVKAAYHETSDHCFKARLMNAAKDILRDEDNLNLEVVEKIDNYSGDVTSEDEKIRFQEYLLDENDHEEMFVEIKIQKKGTDISSKCEKIISKYRNLINNELKNMRFDDEE
ncbi:hypothetical protein ACF0H5_017287 [Mactra antiquata]